MALIDKHLSASSGYTLTTSGDFSVVSDEQSTLQAAQNRILSEVWSWIFDEDYGGLLLELRNTPIQKINNEQVRWLIDEALLPLIEASRILSITSVRILEKLEDSIQVEIKLDLDLSIGTLNINIAV